MLLLKAPAAAAVAAGLSAIFAANVCLRQNALVEVSHSIRPRRMGIPKQHHILIEERKRGPSACPLICRDRGG